MEKKNVCEIVMERIVKELEKGVIPWKMPWKNFQLPRNLVSKKTYRGFNLLLLNTARFASPYWLSFKQCRDLGGRIKDNSKGYPVVYYKKTEAVKDKEGVIVTPEKFVLRYYVVFNAEQTEGLTLPPEEKLQFNPIKNCENILEGYKDKPEIVLEGKEGYYMPKTDKVYLPEKEYFQSEPYFYSALFHELSHSTGHKNRLNREGITNPVKFGDCEYSKEELIAELTASFLCGHAGIVQETIQNSTAYIDGWLKEFNKDKKMLLCASGQAQKAFDYVLGSVVPNENTSGFCVSMSEV